MRGRLQDHDAADESDVHLVHLAVHQHRGAVRQTAVKVGDVLVLTFAGGFLAVQRHELGARLVAQHQRVAHHRIAADLQARQQRVVFIGEVHTEQRGEQAAQAEVFQHHHLTTTHAAAGGHVQREREPAARAVPARQLGRGLQPGAAARFGQGRVKSQADPAGEPVQVLGRRAGRVGEQVSVGHAVFELREHPFHVGQTARQKVGR